MKVLILSDSHAGLSFMRAAIRTVKPDALVHLGDYYEDGQTIAFENPHIPMYQVPGNCDRHRVFGQPEVLCLSVFGALLYMTHGHNHGVKFTKHRLIEEATRAGAQAALYGHTHEADCHIEDSGLWVINPGSCGSYSGSAAVMEIADGVITSCRIITADALTW